MKTGDYENKKAEVIITFSAEPGEDHTFWFDRASCAAHDRCHEIIGIPTRLKLGEAPKPVEATKPTPAKVPPAAKKAAEPAKAQVVAKQVDLEDFDVVKTEAKPADKTDAALLDIPAVLTKPTDPAAVEDDLLTGLPAPVTDKDLIDAVGAKNAQIKNAVAIRQVIGKFVEPPKGVKDIPADARKPFLDMLAKL